MTSSVARLFPLCRAMTFNTVPTSGGRTQNLMSRFQTKLSAPPNRPNISPQRNNSSFIGQSVARHEPQRTCANKHDIILPVLRLHPVHHDLFQLVRNVGFYEERLAQRGVDWPPHQRVVAGELQHRIREVLGATKLSAGLIGDFTGTLERGRRGRGERKRGGEKNEQQQKPTNL